MNNRRFLAITVALSLALHGGIFWLSQRSVGNLFQGLDPRFEQASEPRPAQRQVLLDLKDEKPDPGKDETGKFLASQARQGLGRVTEEKGINRLGQQNQGSLQPQTPVSPSQPKSKPPERSDTGDRVSKLRPSISMEPPVAAWTGEGQALNLGEASARFQIGSEAYIYADFLNHYFKAVVKSLMPYLQANQLAAYLMTDDAVSVLTWVDRQGRIGFDRMLTVSRTQPFLNHAAEGAAQSAGAVPTPPASLFSPSAERVYIPLEISLRGSPGVISLCVPKILPSSKTEAP